MELSCNTKKFTLRYGQDLPPFGVDTNNMKNSEEIYALVDTYLRNGCRHFGCASKPCRQKMFTPVLKDLMQKHGLQREDIYITSTINVSCSMRPEEAYDNTHKLITKSLDNFDLEYIDLYILEFTPSLLAPNRSSIPQMKSASWRAMVDVFNNGLAIGSIGVANFTAKDLKVLQKQHSMLPFVNQVKFSPHNTEDDLYGYCRAEDIVIQAYDTFLNHLIDHPKVCQISKEYEATSLQVLRAWLLQQNVAIFTSATCDNVASNITMDLQLREKDIQKIIKLLKR